MNIKSNHDAVLYFSNYTLRPKTSIAVPDWERVKQSTMARNLLNAGMIEEVPPVVEEEAEEA